MTKNVKLYINRNLNGFTLLEILIVVMLLAVFAGLAIPGFANSYRHFIVRQTVGDMVYLMQYVQSQAILKHTKYKLIMDPQTAHYWIEFQDQPLPGRMGRKFSLPAGIRLENAVKSMAFFPDGKIEPVKFAVCFQSECLTISSQEQMGHVDVTQENSS